jgi:hypothetical protein
MDCGHWKYFGDFDPADWVGFIYRIVDTVNGKEYIGKKNFWSTTRKIVKGRKNRKKTVKESNWKSYTGSSTYLNEEIVTKGKDSFLFIIESLHESKASLCYAEIEAQIVEDVLRAKLPCGTRKYYNRMVGNIKFLPPDETPDETRHKIRDSVRVFWSNTNYHSFDKMTDEEKAQWDIDNRIGLTQDFNGVGQWVHKHLGDGQQLGQVGAYSVRFGKNPWEFKTDADYAEMKSKLVAGTPPEPVKNPFENFTEEEMAARKLMLSKAMSGENNPMFGVNQWDEKTAQEKDAWRAQISAKTKGIPKSEVMKKKVSEAKKGVKLPTVECPHCKKVGAGPNMSRYHFEKCKSAPQNNTTLT